MLHLPFQKLDPITERVIHVKAVCARQQFVVLYQDAMIKDTLLQGGQVLHMDGWVRLLVGDEVRVDPDVDLMVAAAKPYTAPFAKFFRFLKYLHAKYVTKEASGPLLASGWCSELHVIEPNKSR